MVQEIAEHVFKKENAPAIVKLTAAAASKADTAPVTNDDGERPIALTRATLRPSKNAHLTRTRI